MELSWEITSILSVPAEEGPSPVPAGAWQSLQGTPGFCSRPGRREPRQHVRLSLRGQIMSVTEGYEGPGVWADLWGLGQARLDLHGKVLVTSELEWRP